MPFPRTANSIKSGKYAYFIWYNMITYLLDICHVYSPGYPHSILLQFLMILYPKYTSNVATSFLFPGHHISSGLYQVWLNHHDYLLTDVLAFMLTPNSYPVHFPLVAQSPLFLSMSNVAPTLTHSSEPCTSLSPINWLTSFLPQDLCTCHPLYKSCSSHPSGLNIRSFLQRCCL